MIDLVEFWGAIAKIGVKMSVTKHGIPRIQKLAMLFVHGFASIGLSAFEYFGRKQHCAVISTSKYFILAIVVLIMVYKAFFFVKTIDKGILDVPKSNPTGYSKRYQLVWQLRLKFGVFFAVTLSFVALALYLIITNLTTTDTTCLVHMINWSYTFETPYSQILYLLAGYTIVFQFANLSPFAEKIGSRSRSTGKHISEAKSTGKHASEAKSSHSSPGRRTSDNNNRTSALSVLNLKQMPQSPIMVDLINHQHSPKE